MLSLPTSMPSYPAWATAVGSTGLANSFMSERPPALANPVRMTPGMRQVTVTLVPCSSRQSALLQLVMSGQSLRCVSVGAHLTLRSK